MCSCYMGKIWQAYRKWEMLCREITKCNSCKINRRQKNFSTIQQKQQQQQNPWGIEIWATLFPVCSSNLADASLNTHRSRSWGTLRMSEEMEGAHDSQWTEAAEALFKGSTQCLAGYGLLCLGYPDGRKKVILCWILKCFFLNNNNNKTLLAWQLPFKSRSDLAFCENASSLKQLLKCPGCLWGEMEGGSRGGQGGGLKQMLSWQKEKAYSQKCSSLILHPHKKPPLNQTRMGEKRGRGIQNSQLEEINTANTIDSLFCLHW